MTSSPDPAPDDAYAESRAKASCRCAEKLSEYVVHSNTCERRFRTFGDCTCGLEKVMQSFRELSA